MYYGHCVVTTTTVVVVVVVDVYEVDEEGGDENS